MEHEPNLKPLTLSELKESKLELENDFQKYLEESKKNKSLPESDSNDSLNLLNWNSKERKLSSEVKFNPKELEASLKRELEADLRYELINDAKLRALAQGTSTYEDFRQIWMGAHLKPMDKQDKLDSFLHGPGSKVLWNSLSSTGNSKGVSGEGSSIDASGDSPSLQSELDFIEIDVKVFDVKVKTSQELYKCWRKLKTCQGKIRYLQLLLKTGGGSSDPGESYSLLKILWMEEIPSDMFSEVIQILTFFVTNCNLCSEEFQDVLKILEIVSESKRIGITLGFMDKVETGSLQDLLESLEKALIGQDIIEKEGISIKILKDRFLK